MNMMKQSDLEKMTLAKSLAKYGPDHPVTKNCQRDLDALLRAEKRREQGIFRENPIDHST